VKSRDDYLRDYLDSAKRLDVDIEPPAQPITKTAEAAWAIDSYPVEPGDEPAQKGPPRRKR
jgi:hypothetical protein